MSLRDFLMKSIRSYRSEIKAKYQKGFEQTVNQVSDAIQSNITNPRHWDGFENSVTHRQNGEIVKGAYRNIVDLGNARDGHTVEINGDSAKLTWDGNGVTPIQDVYFGQVTDSGHFIAGRPFVHTTLDEINIAEMFRDNVK